MSGDVINLAGGQAADLIAHAEGIGHVERHHLDRGHEVDPKRERQPDKVIEVPLVGERDRARVVGHETHQPRVEAQLRDALDQLGERGHEQIVAQVGIDAVAHANQHVIERHPLVVVGHAERRKGVPRGSVRLGTVTGKHLVRGPRRLDRAEQVGQPEGDVLRHDLADAHDVVALERLLDRARIDMPAARLQAG